MVLVFWFVLSTFVRDLRAEKNAGSFFDRSGALLESPAPLQH